MGGPGKFQYSVACTCIEGPICQFPLLTIMVSWWEQAVGIVTSSAIVAFTIPEKIIHLPSNPCLKGWSEATVIVTPSQPEVSMLTSVQLRHNEKRATLILMLLWDRCLLH